MTKNTAIAVAYGDGIGPEIMEATLSVLREAGAAMEIHPIEIGESIYKKGYSSGIRPDTWDVILNTKAFLKAPITTTQGGGVKSLNVTIRKSMGLYANVRPCIAYAPFVRTDHPDMDVVIVRENEEDLYAGIEYRQTDEVVQSLKLVSRPGCEKIVRYAFEYARKYGRKKVTCFTKDNIMKLTDGLFHKVFNEIAAEYPEIQNEHLIVDIGTARLADTPEIFDVIVTPNLYGDIISDVAAQVAGSIGLAGSANYGDNGAMFEAVHGSAPSIAGQNIANPSGLIQAATLMLLYIGQNEVAEKIQNAWLRTIEDGIHTFDIFTEGVSKERVGTKQFAEAVIQRLGERPQVLKPVSYGPNTEPPDANVPFEPTAPAKKDLVGVDVYIDWHYNRIPDAVAEVLEKVNGDGLVLTMISNRGVKVWPGGFTETFCTDSWRCRFMRTDTGTPLKPEQVVSLLQRIDEHKLDFGKIENLYNFDGEPGYALSQGE